MTSHFPLAYRWFISKGLSNLEPWHFTDDEGSSHLPPDFSKNEFAARAFKAETGADFDVYLFARRQDRDDFAFFVVRDGRIEDKVVTIHLSFANKIEIKSPLRNDESYRSFMNWVGNIVIRDIEDWMTEEDL